LNAPPPPAVGYNDAMLAATALVATLLTASGSAADAQTLAHKVQAVYEHTSDFRARFVQTYVYGGVGRKQVSRGTLAIKKPGKMRWDYAEPSKKTVVLSGSRLVQYEPEANQAYVDEHFDATSMNAAVTFLLGKGNLEKDFDVSPGEGGVLVLTPKKPDPRVASITLTVGPNGEVTGTRVVDGSDNVNQLAFEDVRRNVKLPDSEFELELPKGVQRVGAPGR
jgi:outer membrane lipoprotein carrier protein